MSQGKLLPPWPQLPHPWAGTRGLHILPTVTVGKLCRLTRGGMCAWQSWFPARHGACQVALKGS